MSVSSVDQDYDRGYYDGFQEGEYATWNKIVNLLRPYSIHDDCEDDCNPEECAAPSYEYAIALIQGAFDADIPSE